MVELLSKLEQQKLRDAGRVAADVLREVGACLEVGLTTAAIDEIAKRAIAKHGARSSQLGYHGFPAHVCTSRNEVVCHGIPTERERLCDGDIVNVDVTVEYGGFHGDTSRTFVVGDAGPQARELVATAEAALRAGVAAVGPGARVGDIGAAIRRVVELTGFSIVRDYCGHGIGREMHQEPQIPHWGVPGRGVRLREGMAFTIEPMINAGTHECITLEDQWTVVTADGKWSAQCEHTLVVTSHGCEITTTLA